MLDWEFWMVCCSRFGWIWDASVFCNPRLFVLGDTKIMHGNHVKFQARGQPMIYLGQRGTHHSLRVPGHPYFLRCPGKGHDPPPPLDWRFGGLDLGIGEYNGKLRDWSWALYTHGLGRSIEP